MKWTTRTRMTRNEKWKYYLTLPATHFPMWSRAHGTVFFLSTLHRVSGSSYFEAWYLATPNARKCETKPTRGKKWETNPHSRGRWANVIFVYPKKTLRKCHLFPCKTLAIPLKNINANHKQISERLVLFFSPSLFHFGELCLFASSHHLIRLQSAKCSTWLICLFNRQQQQQQQQHLNSSDWLTRENHWNGRYKFSSSHKVALWQNAISNKRQDFPNDIFISWKWHRPRFQRQIRSECVCVFLTRVPIKKAA